MAYDKMAVEKNTRMWGEFYRYLEANGEITLVSGD